MTVVSVKAVTVTKIISSSQVYMASDSIHLTGAVAHKSTYQATFHRFVNAELNCSGLESNITKCMQNTDEAFSCLSFGIASISCYGKFTSNFCYAY